MILAVAPVSFWFGYYLMTAPVITMYYCDMKQFTYINK